MEIFIEWIKEIIVSTDGKNISIDGKEIREHWNIECGLHWRLDVIMNEDHSRNREKNF